MREERGAEGWTGLQMAVKFSVVTESADTGRKTEGAGGPGSVLK